MPGSSPTRSRRTSTPSGNTGPPSDQQSFRRWAWTVADDVISLRNEFDSFRSRFGDRGADTSRGSQDAISTSRPGPGAQQCSNISLALSPLPVEGGEAVAGRMLRAAADEVLAEVRDEHRTLRCSIEAEQTLLRQELENLRGQLRWHLNDPDTSREDALDVHPMMGKGRLDTMEEAILNLGREILSHAELHGVLEGAHRELQQRVEELREASNAIESFNSERFTNLEQAQRQAESVLMQLQAAAEAQTFGARDLSQDVSRVVETVEFRLQALGEEFAMQRRRTDELVLAFGATQSLNGGLNTIPTANGDSMAESVRIALQANPRRQPSEATRMCRTFRAWLELVAPAVAARTKQAASSSTAVVGLNGSSGSSGATLEQELQLRLARTEQQVLSEARAEVLHHREELCRAVRLELESEPGATRRTNDARYDLGNKAAVALSPRSTGAISRDVWQGSEQLARLGTEVSELRRLCETRQAEMSALNDLRKVGERQHAEMSALSEAMAAIPDALEEMRHDLEKQQTTLGDMTHHEIAAQSDTIHSRVNTIGTEVHEIESAMEARIEASMVDVNQKLSLVEARFEDTEASYDELASLRAAQHEAQRETKSLTQIEDHLGTALHTVDRRVDSLEARMVDDIEAARHELTVVETRLEAMEKSSLQLGALQNSMEDQAQLYNSLTEELRAVQDRVLVGEATKMREELVQQHPHTQALECSCGYTFLEDSMYCRRCGAKRPDAIDGDVARDLNGLLESCAQEVVPVDNNVWVQKISTALIEQEVVSARLQQEFVAMSEALTAQQETLAAVSETKASSVDHIRARSRSHTPEATVEGAISPFSEALEVQREMASSAVGEELRQMAVLATKNSNAIASSRITEEEQSKAVVVQLPIVCACGTAFPAEYSMFCRNCGAKRPELQEMQRNIEHNHGVADIHGTVEQPRIGRLCDAELDDTSPESGNPSACLATTVPGTPTRFPWGIGGSMLPTGSQRQKAASSRGDDELLQHTLESLTSRVEEALELRSDQTKLHGVLETLAAEVNQCREERHHDMSSVCDELKLALHQGRQEHDQVESLSARVDELWNLQQLQSQCVTQTESLNARVEEVFEMQQKQNRVVTQPERVPIKSPIGDQSKLQGAIDNLSIEVYHCRDEQRCEMSSVRDELKLALFEGRQARSQAVKLKAEFEQACADLGDQWVESDEAVAEARREVTVQHATIQQIIAESRCCRTQWVESEDAIAEVNGELAVQNARMQQIVADTQCCRESEDTLREEIYQVSKGLVELQDTSRKSAADNEKERCATEVEFVRLNEGVQEVKLDNAKMVSELASLAERVHEAAQTLRDFHEHGEASREQLQETPMAISALRTELTGTWEELEQWASREVSLAQNARRVGDDELQEELSRLTAEVQEDMQQRRHLASCESNEETVSRTDDELRKTDAKLQEAVLKTNDELRIVDAEIQEHQVLLLTMQSDFKQMAIESHSRQDEEAQLRSDNARLRSDFISLCAEMQEQESITASAIAELKDIPAAAISAEVPQVDTSGFLMLESRVREISAELQKLRRRSANGYSPGPPDAYWERDRDCWEEVRMITSEMSEQRVARLHTDQAVGALSSALRAIELRLADKEKDRSKQAGSGNAKQLHGLPGNSPALFGAMEDWKAGVAELRNALCSTWEAEDAQAHVQICAYDNARMATSPEKKTGDDGVLSRISELDLQGQRTAVTVEKMIQSQHEHLQEISSLREALTGFVKESEATQLVAREVETKTNERLSKAILETRGHLHGELVAHAAEMRTYIAERATAIAVDWGPHREAQQAISSKLGHDIEMLQKLLGEVVDDSVDMRKQVLTLCDSRCQTPHGSCSLHLNEMSQRLSALSEDVSALSHTVVAPHSQQLAAIRMEVSAIVAALQAEVRRLASQLNAGEQNAQRGLSSLHRAVESLQEELQQMRQRPGALQQG